MNSTRHFFHRPKTPTIAARLRGDSDPQSSSSLARPKLSEQIDSLSTHEPASKSSKLKDRGEPLQKSPENEAAKPFVYLRGEYESLYLGLQKPIRMMETIHDRLMSDIQSELPINFNGQLCRIFESYRSLIEENMKLTTEAQQHIRTIDIMQRARDDDKQQWQEDEQRYEEEIKRLESLVAHCNQEVEGLGKVCLEKGIQGQRQPFERNTIDTTTQDHEEERSESLVEFLRSSRRNDLSPSKLRVPRRVRLDDRNRSNLQAKSSMAALSDSASSPKSAKKGKLASQTPREAMRHEYVEDIYNRSIEDAL